MKKSEIKKFQKLVWDFYKKNKRNFPWRETTDPYKILVSEIMLQQTQADRVVPYYKNWIKKFPNPKRLAASSFNEIYPFWQGLGYNRRALFLKRAAEEITTHGWPADLETLPGVGKYTARAVNIFSFNAPVACIETNIRRVFIHHFFADRNGIDDKEILKIAELALPVKKSREWHWALMDYGAYLKSQIPNPNRRHKNYAIQSTFEGSLRQIRGELLRLLAKKKLGLISLIETIGKEPEKVKDVLEVLTEEGFVEYKNSKYSLR